MSIDQIAMPNSTDKGRMLEERIAAYFTSAAYAVNCNQVLVGRSGGGHEIDILAEKTGPLMTVRVMVECKAWNRPIEKDVISKVDYIIKDLGLNKGIIVSLNGWRSGALQAAGELGIDLWGPAELSLQLGNSVVSQLNIASRTPEHALGYPFLANEANAEQKVVSSGKALFGLRTVETLVRVKPAWLPVYRVHITVSRLVKQALRREKVINVPQMNAYDAVTGLLVGLPPIAPIAIELTSGVLAPRLKPVQITASLESQIKSFGKLRQAAALERTAHQLAVLGIATPLHSLTIEAVDLVYLPYFVGLLDSGDTRRIVAVSGTSGEIRDAIGTALTGQLNHVLHSLGD